MTISMASFKSRRWLARLAPFYGAKSCVTQVGMPKTIEVKRLRGTLSIPRSTDPMQCLMQFEQPVAAYGAFKFFVYFGKMLWLFLRITGSVRGLILAVLITN